MITKHNIEHLNGRRLFDVDFTPDGTWVAIVGTNDNAHSAIHLGNEIRLHRRFRYPIVRLVDHHRFLVVDARCDKSDDNASLISIETPWKPVTFHAGDGIQDAIVTASHIVFTYFDEGVFGDTPISHEGLSVFSPNGEYRFGYLSRLKSAAVDVADCYAACHINGDEIAFCPYTNFPLVNWNLKTGSQVTASIPSDLRGPAAITAHRGTYFFHASYKSKAGLFQFETGTSRQIGEHAGRLKSLRDGKFLSLDTDGFSVLDCESAG